ncbi:MAG: hypothetical protein KKG59_06785 [Nanoarchaeota archaeon]|nr:hypothetical protein [Nanoarchaeota archaeon]
MHWRRNNGKHDTVNPKRIEKGNGCVSRDELERSRKDLDKGKIKNDETSQGNNHKQHHDRRGCDKAGERIKKTCHEKASLTLVIDANVLFAALIRDGLTRRTLPIKRLVLFSPDFSLEEFDKYNLLIQEKTGCDPKELYELLNSFRKYIRVVPQNEFIDYLTEASRFCPDPNDIRYFALAIKLNCPLWSNDKKLKEQDRIAVYNTQELKLLLDL